MMEEAPFFEDVADGPPGGAAHWLTTEDGLRIRVGHWTRPEPDGPLWQGTKPRMAAQSHRNEEMCVSTHALN